MAADAWTDEAWRPTCLILKRRRQREEHAPSRIRPVETGLTVPRQLVQPDQAVIVEDIVDIEPKVQLSAVQNPQDIAHREIGGHVGLYQIRVGRLINAVLLADILSQQRSGESVEVENRAQRGGAIGRVGKRGRRMLVMRVVQGRIAVERPTSDHPKGAFELDPLVDGAPAIGVERRAGDVPAGNPVAEVDVIQIA